MAVSTFAAIDVGSYEIQMKIFEISAKNKIVQIDHVRHVLEIGKDTYTYGKVSFEVIYELCEVLTDFARIMKEYQVDVYEAYTTSGIREASNCRIILDRIKVRTGIEVKILSNSEQGFISLMGIALKGERFHELIKEGTVVIDVGSGSIQISLFENQHLTAARNIKLGSMRIRELLYSLSNDREHLDLLIEELIENDLETFRRMILDGKTVKNMIALGDNIVWFARKGTEFKVREDMTRKQFLERFRTLTAKSPMQISEKIGVTEEQATLLIPSVLVYKKMIEETDAQNIWIPASDLCDGIVAQYAVRSGKQTFTHDYREDIVYSARMMAERYKTDMGYIQVLESNVLNIFDATKKIHGLGKRERMLLEIATILSDVGKYISMTYAGQCAYDIIMNSEILGLSGEERTLVANVVKYNFDNVLEHGNAANNLTLVKLTAILKLATAMDRSHRKKFKNLKIDLKDNAMYITARTKDDITLEKGLFARKAAFFEEVYGITPVIKQNTR